MMSQQQGGQRNFNKNANEGGGAGRRENGAKERMSTEPMDSQKILDELDMEHSMTLRFLINRDSAGRIIGKGGETVKQLREQFDCRVQIPDSGTVERVLSVTGKLGQLFGCVEDILGKTQKQSGIEKADNFEIRQLVHQSQAGAVIGNKGVRIKQLRTENNCQVRCFPECCPNSTDRIVRIAGERDSAMVVLKLCVALCLNSPPKGSVVDYNSQFYDPNMVSEYGGIGSEFAARSMNQMGRGQPMPPVYGDRNAYPHDVPHAYRDNYGNSGPMYPGNNMNDQRMPPYPMNNQSMPPMNYQNQPQHPHPGQYNAGPSTNLPPYAQPQSNYRQNTPYQSQPTSGYGAQVGQFQKQSPPNSNDWNRSVNQTNENISQSATPYGYLNASNTSSTPGQSPYTQMTTGPNYGSSSYQQNQPSYGQNGQSPYGRPQDGYSNYGGRYGAAPKGASPYNKPPVAVNKAKNL